MRTFWRSKGALLFQLTYIIIAVVLLGTFVYICERGQFRVTEDYPRGAFFRESIDGQAQQDTVSPYTSVPVSIYWAVITITTVGYGDLAPSTVGGRVFACIIALCGLLLIGIMTSVLGQEYNEFYRKFLEKEYEKEKKMENVNDGRKKKKMAGVNRQNGVFAMFSNLWSTHMLGQQQQQQEQQQQQQQQDNRPYQEISPSKVASVGECEIIKHAKKEVISYEEFNKMPNIDKWQRYQQLKKELGLLEQKVNEVSQGINKIRKEL